VSYWEPNQGKSDEWYTPPSVFEALGCMFDLDVAAPIDRTHCHVPAAGFITAESLARDWHGFIWMNPPYGKRGELVPWIEKFISHGNGIALLPDRTSAPWFWLAWRSIDLALFTRKIRFIQPDGRTGDNPSNGSAFMGIGDRASDALRNAEAAGFGILAVPSA
jgi:hypothetical protein